jgi:hypothetical protein
VGEKERGRDIERPANVALETNFEPGKRDLLLVVISGQLAMDLQAACAPPAEGDDAAVSVALPEMVSEKSAAVRFEAGPDV